MSVRVAFTDAASVPACVRFAHADKPTAPFVPAGEVHLRAQSLTQLRHLFRLGPDSPLRGCLRITFAGHLADTHAGALGARRGCEAPRCHAPLPCAGGEPGLQTAAPQKCPPATLPLAGYHRVCGLLVSSPDAPARGADSPAFSAASAAGTASTALPHPERGASDEAAESAPPRPACAEPELATAEAIALPPELPEEATFRSLAAGEVPSKAAKVRPQPGGGIAARAVLRGLPGAQRRLSPANPLRPGHNLPRLLGMCVV